MNKLANLLVTGGCVAVIYTAGKLSGMADMMKATNEVLDEHDLKMNELTWKIPYKLPLKGTVKVSLEKLNKE